MEQPIPVKPGKIFSKISAIMKAVESISKARSNEQQHYKYRGIDDMYNELHKHFAKHEVFITSEVLGSLREERATKTNGMLMYTILDVKFTFYTIDGSCVTSTMKGEAMDTADKSTNKAMSTAYKYALMQLLMIPTEDDKDPDAKTHDPAAKKPASATQQAYNNRRAAQSTPATAPPPKPITEVQKVELARCASLTHVFSEEERKLILGYVAKNPTFDQAEKAIVRYNGLITERERVLLEEKNSESAPVNP